MKLVSILIIGCMCACIYGCNGKHCISIDGGYGGFTGGGTWCWETEKTKEIGAPILSYGGEDAVLLTECDAEKINALVDGESGCREIKEKKDSQIKRLIQKIRVQK